MRIGINLLYLLPGIVGGTETYARGLLSGLSELDSQHEYFIFANNESYEDIKNTYSKFNIIKCPVFAISRINRYFFEQIKLPSYIKKHRIDLLHSLGYTIPLKLSCFNVVTVPDLNYKAFGNLMPITRRLILNFFVKESIKRSNRVITISEFSKREILKEYKVPDYKVVVTYLASEFRYNCNIELRKQENGVFKYKNIKPYFVAFSSTYPNKNIPQLIKVFTKLKKNRRINHKLVLIGHKPENLSKETGDFSSEVFWTNYVERNFLFEILKNADFMAFPSYYEGFGLPILEAMELGLPVVCSQSASIPEVAGDAAVYFDPFSIDDIADKIEEISKNVNLRMNLKERGFENIKRFSWKKTASETVAIYESLKQ